jgi:hypothetical protein
LAKVDFRSGRFLDLTLVVLAAFFCIGTVVAQFPAPTQPLPKVHEAFDPALQSINSLDEAVSYVTSRTAVHDPAALAAAADEFVRRRFYHGYSQFTPSHDWLAYLAGYVFIDLRSPVIPDDILRYPQAACSQQSLVFEALMRRLGVESGSVWLEHHFIAAAKIGGEWRVFDADREIGVRSYPLTKLLKGDPAIIALYGKYGPSIDLAGQIARHEVKLTYVGRNPALHCTIFQRLTHFFSRFGWALFLALASLRFARPGVLRPVPRPQSLPAE